MTSLSRSLLPSTTTSTPTLTSTATSLPSSTSILDGPNVDDNNCVLLGPFALFIQALMGILVILTLVYKRHREVPKRPWKIWSLDISKQMLGQAFVHTLNVLLSDSIAKNDKGNPCALYFLNIAVDTTIGVFIIYLILRVATHVLTDVYHLSGFVSGEYFDPAPPVEIRRRRENERRRNRRNMKSKRKGIGRRQGSVLSVNSIGSVQSQPLPSTSTSNRTLDSNEDNEQSRTIQLPSTPNANPHPSSATPGSGIRRSGGRPNLKNSFSHPNRTSSDSFYGPLSPSSVNNSLSGSTTSGLPAPNSSRSNSNLNSTSNKVSQRPRLAYWSRQLLVYLVALLLMKLSVLLIFWIFPFLFTMGKWLLSLFGKHKRAQVVFAMAIFPLIMNVLQFWLIDTLLRHNPNTSSYSKLIPEDLGERDGLIFNGEEANGNADGIARESGEYDYEEDEDEGSIVKKARRSQSRDSSEDYRPGGGGEEEEEEEDDGGWGWGESSRRSLESFGNQARKGFNAIKGRLNPNPNSTSNDQSDVFSSNPVGGGSTSSKRSSRKGVPQSLRFSDRPAFPNESQTHLVGEASDDDEENGNPAEDGIPAKSHGYPPSLEASPVSSPRSSTQAKLGLDKERDKSSLVEVVTSAEDAVDQKSGQPSVDKRTD